MKKIKYLLLALITSVLSLFSAGQASAAGRAIAISPMYQKMVLIPGETYRGGFTIANPYDATNDLNYLVEISPYYPVKANESDKNYTGADLTTKNSRNLIVDWVTIDNPTGSIQPNGEAYVTFTVNVPNDAPAGGQYAALIAQENPEHVKYDNSVAVNEAMRMAHVLYAEVAGETNHSGEILENNVPSFLFGGTLEASSFVRNNGNVHTDVEYILQVWPMFSDEEICTNEENAGTGFIMPETEVYHTEACDLPPVGLFRAKQTVKIFGEESIVEKTVIVCPLWLIFVILFVVIALIIWIVIHIRSRKKAR